MNTQQQDCLKEQWSARTIGLLILPLALIVGFVFVLLVPFVGFFLALPLVLFSLMFIFAPESKACRLILKKKG